MSALEVLILSIGRDMRPTADNLNLERVAPQDTEEHSEDFGHKYFR